ncbi:MAG: glycosyltransferase family 4 protein, partial [Patescibacteria group bacterium]
SDILKMNYSCRKLFYFLLKKIFSKKMKLIAHYHMDTMASGFKCLIFKLSARLILPLIIKSADAVTCASLDYVENSDAGVFYKKYKEKFFETGFGVDLEKFRPARSAISEKNILFVGGLDSAHYFKGVDVLLEAFKIISSEFPDCNLTIAGDGDRRECYVNMAEDLAVADKVRFLGKVGGDELAELYRDCAFLVLPSVNKSEAYGLVLLEAIASGKPVIASNLPGVRSVFEKGKQGLLAEPGNIGDLAERMRELLVDDRLREEMGREARILAEEKYSWGRVGEMLEEVYKGLNH